MGCCFRCRGSSRNHLQGVEVKDLTSLYGYSGESVIVSGFVALGLLFPVWYLLLVMWSYILSYFPETDLEICVVPYPALNSDGLS